LYFGPLDAFSTERDKAEVQSFVTTAIQAIPSKVPPALAGGIDGWDEVFLEDVRARIQRDLSDLASLRVAFSRGLERSVRVLLMETHSPLAKVAVTCARKAGIPVVVLQHGVIADPTSYRDTEADHVAAWGALDAAWFRANLSRPGRIEPTGNPRYDRLSIPLKVARHASLQGIPVKSRILLFASAPFGHLRATDSLWDHEALLSMAIGAAHEIKDAFLLFKHHPAEQPAPVPGNSRGSSKRFREVSGGDTFALIEASEIVLSIGSTVTLEAMYLNRPTIFLGRADPQSPFHPPEDGAGLRAHSEDELKVQLVRLIEDTAFRRDVLRNQKSYLEKSFAPLDGRAAERVVALLRAG